MGICLGAYYKMGNIWAYKISKKIQGERKKQLLKNQYGDLLWERSSGWKSGEDIDQIDKEMTKIAKKLQTEFKLNAWEY